MFDISVCNEKSVESTAPSVEAPGGPKPTD